MKVKKEKIESYVYNITLDEADVLEINKEKEGIEKLIKDSHIKSGFSFMYPKLNKLICMLNKK